MVCSRSLVGLDVFDPVKPFHIFTQRLHRQLPWSKRSQTRDGSYPVDRGATRM